MAAYVEGSQSEHFKKTFEKHLVQCDRCQAELALLLKTAVTQVLPGPSVVPAESISRRSLLELLFDWTKATAFRPVFAILIVSVVTGVVGYRLIRDDQSLRMRSVETVGWNSSPEAVADKPPATPAPDEPSPGVKSESSPVRREMAQDRLEAVRTSQGQPGDLRNKGQTNSADNEMKDAFAVEPPPAANAQSSRDVAEGPKRSDMAVARQVAPKPLQKESFSAAVVDRPNSQPQTKIVDETTDKPGNSAVPAAPSPTLPALGALSERKAEQDNLAHSEEVREGSASVKKKQVKGEGLGQTSVSTAAVAKAVSRIEAGGKRFDLNGGFWKDASILPDDPWPTPVEMDSPDYERYRRQLAPFQPVLSRPEDVLIKLHNRVYRVRKAPK